MRCQVCGKDNQLEAQTCRFCGATVRAVFGKGIPPPPGLEVEREERRKRGALRRRRRLFWHAVAGAIILFAVATLANVAGLLFVPDQMLLVILRSIPVALIFGPPIGLITSWRNYGPLGGAVVGSLAFAAGIYFMGGGSPLGSLLVGAVPGIFVGGLMGFHVSSDND